MSSNNEKNINKAVVMNKERIYELIRKPIITEKSTFLSSNNQYVFEVSTSATKAEIKNAIEFLFKVSVTKVATINQIGKKKVFKGRIGKRNDFKKAIVTVGGNQAIDLSAGV